MNRGAGDFLRHTRAPRLYRFWRVDDRFKP